MLGKFLSCILFLSLTSQLNASPHTGTLSKLRGSVEILSGGTKSVSGKGPHVKYNGRYYSLTKPGIGDKIRVGEIVRTGKKSLARIIFENGDQFIVGPGSEYNLQAPKAIEKKGASLINLTRGKLRAIISKDGPRNKMKVETRNVAMGVRGTDFYVDAKGFDRSEVSVIRGEVKLKEKAVEKIVKKKRSQIKVVRNSTEEKREVTLKTGYSAKFTVAKKLETLAKSDKKKISKKAKKELIETNMVVKKTTKEKLVKIQKNSIVKETKEEKEKAKKVDKKTKEKIAKLEEKAVKVTIADIKTHTPELYKQIKKDGEEIKSADQLSTKVVSEAYKVAPKEEKASADELDMEELSEDAYDKYFKL